MAVTLEDLKNILQHAGSLAAMHDWIDMLARAELITPQEELVIKVRLRAKIRTYLDSIPKDEG